LTPNPTGHDVTMSRRILARWEGTDGMLDQDVTASAVPLSRVDGAGASLLTIGAAICGSTAGLLTGVSQDVGLTTSSIAAAVACWCAVCVALAAGSKWWESADSARNRSLAFVSAAVGVVVVPVSSLLAGWPLERSVSIALPLGVVFVLGSRQSSAMIRVSASWVAATCGVAAALIAVIGTSRRTIESDAAVVVGLMAVPAVVTMLLLIVAAPLTRGAWLLLALVATIAAAATPIVPTIAAFAAAAWCALRVNPRSAIATPERRAPATRVNPSRLAAIEHARIGVHATHAAEPERLPRPSPSGPDTEHVKSSDLEHAAEPGSVPAAELDPDPAVVGDLRERLRRALETDGPVPPAAARTRSSPAFGSGPLDQEAFLSRFEQALNEFERSRSSTPEHHHNPRDGHDHHQ
jgi:hypothetical protein